ncbi:hypothetical protein BC332_19102 [Capsicum chinense]|nr:hypothetical protein BC332_19102 [Capsicum chinense]
MPAYFVWKEFAMVTRLKCNSPSPSQIIPTLTKKTPCTPKKGKGKLSDREDFVSIVGSSFKNKNLIEALKGKGLSKKHKKSLCLVWFVHNIHWARDVNNNISPSLINLSEDLEAFNSYHWGYESFKITVQYLLTSLTPKTVNLYGFPWAFMAKHDGVINAINELTASVKEMESKRGVILSKRISYPYTPLDIKAAKRRRKSTSKVDVTVEATAEKHNITVDNPSTTSKEEEKVRPVSSGERKNYPFEGFNISDESPKKLTQLIKYNSKWIADGLLKHHVGRDCDLFVATYAEYLSDGLQVANDGINVVLLRKRYVALLWKYEEVKA